MVSGERKQMKLRITDEEMEAMSVDILSRNLVRIIGRRATGWHTMPIRSHDHLPASKKHRDGSVHIVPRGT